VAEVLISSGRATAAITLASFFVGTESSLSSGSFTTESNAARTQRIAGTFQDMGGSFNASGTARSIRFRKNSANATSVLSPADSTAVTVYDATDTDHYTTADTRDIQFNGTAPAYTVNWLKSVFVADSKHVGLFCGAVAPTTSTLFIPINGNVSSGTESVEQVTARTSGTLSNTGCYLPVSTTAAMTITSRKNTAAGGISVTINAGTTGIFEDNTNTTAFVSGDLLDWSIASTTAATILIIECYVTYNAFAAEVGWGASSVTFSASDQFGALAFGQLVSTTESTWQMHHDFAATTSNFRIRVNTNTMTGTTTFRTRKNGADGNQVVTFAAAATGLAEDTTHTDMYLPTDTVNWVVRGGTSGAITPSHGNLTEVTQTQPLLPPTEVPPRLNDPVRVVSYHPR
jgi:hypothetical protein